jgi:membrane protein involved in colicin uptake
MGDPVSIVTAVTAVVGTAASVYGQYQQSQGQASQLNTQAQQAALQARQAEIAARQEELRGQSDANAVREALLRNLATQNARYAAAGVMLADGTTETVAEAAKAEAERELTIRGAGADQRAAAARGEAAGQRTRASLLEDSAELTSTLGTIGAIATGLEGASRVAARWPGSTTAGTGQRVP